MVNVIKWILLKILIVAVAFASNKLCETGMKFSVKENMYLAKHKNYFDIEDAKTGMPDGSGLYDQAIFYFLKKDTQLEIIRTNEVEKEKSLLKIEAKLKNGETITFFAEESIFEKKNFATVTSFEWIEQLNEVDKSKLKTMIIDAKEHYGTFSKDAIEDISTKFEISRENAKEAIQWVAEMIKAGKNTENFVESDLVEFSPGIYKVLNQTYATKGIEKNSTKGQTFHIGAKILITHVQAYLSESRIRGRIPNGDWLSIYALDTNKEFLKKEGKEDMDWFHVCLLQESKDDLVEHLIQSVQHYGNHWNINKDFVKYMEQKFPIIIASQTQLAQLYEIPYLEKNLHARLQKKAEAKKKEYEQRVHSFKPFQPISSHSKKTKIKQEHKDFIKLLIQMSFLYIFDLWIPNQLLFFSLSIFFFMISSSF